MSSAGARVACITPIAPATALNVLFADVVAQPAPKFLDAIAPIEVAGYIPGVMVAARCTLDEAEDAKNFGELVDDLLSIDEIALLMKYSARHLSRHTPLAFRRLCKTYLRH